jgi:hypothetical protein
MDSKIQERIFLGNKMIKVSFTTKSKIDFYSLIA